MIDARTGKFDAGRNTQELSHNVNHGKRETQREKIMNNARKQKHYVLSARHWELTS